MRIAVISTMGLVAWGGSEELWAEAAGEALGAGHEVAISLHYPPGGRLAPKVIALRDRGARVLVRPFSFAPRLQRAPALYRAFCAVTGPYRRLFRFKPDVILFSFGLSTECLQFYGVPGMMARLGPGGIPYVPVSQLNADNAGAPSDQARGRMADFYERAYRAAFVSERNRACFKRQLAGRLTRSLVVRNPVNLADRSALPWPASAGGGGIGEGGSPLRLACVARLETNHKGQDLLFEALGADAWRGRDWRLRLYGEGWHRGYLQELADFYKLGRRVEFMGQVSDIRAVWADNHLLVLPSRGEGTPLALVEAMLCGRPAVVTDVGGNAEWVQEGRSGFVAPAPTVSALSEALERAWRASADWPEMGRRAHETAAAQFDPHPGRTVLNLLIEAARSRRPDAG